MDFSTTDGDAAKSSANGDDRAQTPVPPVTPTAIFGAAEPPAGSWAAPDPATIAGGAPQADRLADLKSRVRGLNRRGLGLAGATLAAAVIGGAAVAAIDAGGTTTLQPASSSDSSPGTTQAPGGQAPTDQGMRGPRGGFGGQAGTTDGTTPDGTTGTPDGFPGGGPRGMGGFPGGMGGGQFGGQTTDGQMGMPPGFGADGGTSSFGTPQGGSAGTVDPGVDGSTATNL